MAERNVFRDEQIQDYIDGRLNERDRAAVAAYLLAHPRVAAEVDTIRRQSEALRALGQEILDAPVPEHLRRILREDRAGAHAVRGSAAPRRIGRQPLRRASSFLETAAAILLLCVGSAIGWFAHDVLRPAPSVEDMLLSDMSRAYAFYGARDYPVAFPPDRAAHFVTWIDRSFQREVRPPDLAQFGYSYQGGRVIPGASGDLGLFQYKHPGNPRLAVFFWRTAAPPRLTEVLRYRNDLAARFWITDGLSFAVISDKANRDLETAARAIFAFYDESFRSR